MGRADGIGGVGGREACGVCGSPRGGGPAVIIFRLLPCERHCLLVPHPSLLACLTIGDALPLESPPPWAVASVSSILVLSLPLWRLHLRLLTCLSPGLSL